jgi:two-component system copper resistance phosphate regulon response regulator CusR
MLPVLDGWQVLARLREADKKALVLMLTARDAVHERVRGFEMGADDYLVKPFAFSELLARVRSLLRRSTPRPQEALRMADLEIDLLRHRATRAGQRLELTSKEFLLLTLLARRAGEVLSRTLIAESVWDMNFDSDTNVVDVNVRRLRSKVDDPFPVKLIHIVRGLRCNCAEPWRSDCQRPIPWRACCWWCLRRPVSTSSCEPSWIEVVNCFSQTN